MTQSGEQNADIRRAVADVIADVRQRGDAALFEYTSRWDKVQLTSETVRVPVEKLRQPAETTAGADRDFVEAFRRAADRIERFHDAVRPRTSVYEDDEGAILGLRWTPIHSVGLYVPGGKASYPSTLAMTAIPARIAGVERIVVVTPPGPDGEISPQVLLAARVLGIEEVYRVGGAQAVAALALGTESIPRVDKIFGPGNAFVAEAKGQLYGEVGIDMLAGPSELVVYADESAEPAWIAADLLAQAEHDESTAVTLLAASDAVRDAVRGELERQVIDEPRRKVIEVSLANNSRFEVCGSHADAARRIDEIAPEHLSLQVIDPWEVLPLFRNAGAIFLGKESPVAVGDYYAGPNHVLPTGRSARFASCLSVEDFMKRSNLARLPLDFVRRASSDVDTLARGEGLPAHGRSVVLRRGTDGPRARVGVRAVTPYTIVEEEGETKLNQNESPFDVPDEIKDEVARRLKGLAWNRYHQKVPERLREVIAADAAVDTECVIAGSGSNLVLQWVFEAFGGTGRTMLTPAPSFSLYPLWARVTETQQVTVPLDERFEYDVDGFLRAIERERPELVVLCLPNNPTGGELALDGVVAIADACRAVGGLTVVDEAYREFSAATHDRTSLVRERDDVILVRTCSKAFSAAGMRLGYLLASQSIADELRKVVPPFHLNLFAAVLGQVLWERKALFAERVAEILAERQRLESALSRFPDLEVFPSHANFFLLRTPRAREVHEALAAEGVLIRRLGGDERLADCLRVNAGRVEENDRFLSILERVLSAPGTGGGAR